MWITALTFLKNFKLECGYVAAFALVCGIGLGGYGVKVYMKARVLEAQNQTLQAEKNLSDFQAQLATNAADATRDAAKRQADAYAQINKVRDDIVGQVSLIPSAVAAQVAPQIAILRGIVNGSPDLKCLTDSPLPDDYLRLLERPGVGAF